MNKILKTNKVLPILLIAFAVITSIMTAKDGGDFDVYLDAANKLSDSSNIYSPPFVKGLQYYYSVFFAWLLIPFSDHIFITEFLWMLFSYALLYRAFILSIRYFDLSILTENQYRLWIFSIVFFSLQFVLYNVAMIQITFFLLWAILESVNQIYKGKFVIGGFILGLAINIKLMPILILPFLFYRGYFKGLFVTILTFILLLFIPALNLGCDFNNYLLKEWWVIINPSNKEHLFETGIGTHSIVALLPVYLTETIGEMPFKRNIFNLNHNLVEIIINISRLLLLSISLFYFKSMPFKKELNKLKLFRELSYFTLIIPLLLPHQQKYAFILAIPMISYLLYFFIVSYKYNNPISYYILLFSFYISLLLFSPLYGSDVIGKFLFEYTQHFRFLTFSTLLIIPISIICSPEKIQESNIKLTVPNSVQVP